MNVAFKYMVDFNSTIKKTEIVKISGKCMKVENILSEVTQSKKKKCHLFLSYVDLNF